MDKGSPGEFGNLLVVLNVDGSSPSGHPKDKTPVVQKIAGVFFKIKANFAAVCEYVFYRNYHSRDDLLDYRHLASYRY